MKVEKSIKQGIFEYGYTHTNEFDSPHLHQREPLSHKALSGFSFSYGDILVTL